MDIVIRMSFLSEMYLNKKIEIILIYKYIYFLSEVPFEKTRVGRVLAFSRTPILHLTWRYKLFSPQNVSLLPHSSNCRKWSLFTILFFIFYFLLVLPYFSGPGIMGTRQSSDAEQTVKKTQVSSDSPRLRLYRLHSSAHKAPNSERVLAVRSLHWTTRLIKYSR